MKRSCPFDHIDNSSVVVREEQKEEGAAAATTSNSLMKSTDIDEHDCFTIKNPNDTTLHQRDGGNGSHTSNVVEGQQEEEEQKEDQQHNNDENGEDYDNNSESDDDIDMQMSELREIIDWADEIETNCCFKSSNDDEFVETLNKYMLNPSFDLSRTFKEGYKPSRNFTLLTYAIYHNKMSIVKILVSEFGVSLTSSDGDAVPSHNGPHTNATSSWRSFEDIPVTPLQAAILSNSKKMAHYVIEILGVDVNELYWAKRLYVDNSGHKPVFKYETFATIQEPFQLVGLDTTSSNYYDNTISTTITNKSRLLSPMSYGVNDPTGTTKQLFNIIWHLVDIPYKGKPSPFSLPPCRDIDIEAIQASRDLFCYLLNEVGAYGIHIGLQTNLDYTYKSFMDAALFSNAILSPSELIQMIALGRTYDPRKILLWSLHYVFDILEVKKDLPALLVQDRTFYFISPSSPMKLLSNRLFACASFENSMDCLKYLIEALHVNPDEGWGNVFDKRYHVVVLQVEKCYSTRYLIDNGGIKIDDSLITHHLFALVCHDRPHSSNGYSGKELISIIELYQSYAPTFDFTSLRYPYSKKDKNFVEDLQDCSLLQAYLWHTGDWEIDNLSRLINEFGFNGKVVTKITKKTCLMLLCSRFKASASNLISYLIRNTKCDVNAQDNQGNTALMYAAKNFRENVYAIQVLLDHGANPHIKNAEGATFFTKYPNNKIVINSDGKVVTNSF